MTIWQKLTEKSVYTATECAIIDFLEQNRQVIQQLTISQLARETFSSNASIIRLCHKLGYQGFRDFRMALLTGLESEKYLDKTIDYTRPFDISETTEQISQSLFSLYQKSINQVQSTLDLGHLEVIAEQLFYSQRVFLFGYGDVMLTLKSFINKLAKINLFPILATENGEEPAIIKHIGRKDAALFMTYSGTNQAMLAGMRQLRKRGVPVFLITANENSPLLSYCQAQLIIPDLEKDHKIATFYSQLSFDYLLNLLYTLIYQHQADQE